MAKLVKGRWKARSGKGYGSRKAATLADRRGRKTKAARSTTKKRQKRRMRGKRR